MRPAFFYTQYLTASHSTHVLKEEKLATDSVPRMRSIIYGLTPLLLVALGLGCSSKSSQGDGGKVSEAGAIDGGSTVNDGPRRLDTRDSSLAQGEAGALRDTKEVGIDAQGRDIKDVSGDASANDTTGNRDGKRDGNLDIAQQPDVPVDTASILGSCATPIEISFDKLHTDLSVSTTNAQHILDFPCASNGADIVFKIQSNEPEMVYADTFGTTWNTALFFSETCDSPKAPEGAEMATCNDDACGTSQSQAYATLAYGYHYLIVSGVNGESGQVTVHFQHVPIGNGPLVVLPKGAGTISGTTDGIDISRTCDTSGPKNSYWWVSCPSDLGGSFHASTCKGADWDSFLIFQIPRLDSLSCNDDDVACGMQSTADATIPPGAGMFVLTVGGTLIRSYGIYTITYIRP
jgi:hypothetical protein